MGFTNCIRDNIRSNDVEKVEVVHAPEPSANQRVLESAKRWLPVRELTGNNDHPMITVSMELCGLPGDKKYPWCASSHSEIFDHAKVNTVKSARVVDWFKEYVVWERSQNHPIPKKYLSPGMSVGFYYKKLNRYGHIGLLVHSTDKYAYTYEGNTSPKGQFDPETFENLEAIGTGVQREGDGFYPKIRPWYSIDVISDKCLQGAEFSDKYGQYLKNAK
jgi:hypothetical protein